MAVMKIRLLCLLLLWQSGQSSVIQRNIEYHKYPRSWQYAEWFCKKIGKQLLTVVTQSEINNKNMDFYYAWIGLKENSNSWYWVDGVYADRNDNFVDKEPQKSDDCAMTAFMTPRAMGDPCGQEHFFFCNPLSTSQFTFHFQAKSWDDAFQYCRNTEQSLARFYYWNNLPSYEPRNFPVWTGLYHDGESWRWSDGEYSDYWKWASGFDPGSSPSSGLCGSVWSQNKSMSVHSCSEALPFLCYSHNLVLVKQNLTWEEALEECKSLQTNNPSQSHQLLSVKPSELLYANSKAIDAQTDKVWLGLRFLGGFWFWSNRQTVSLPGLPSCPESTLGCGALVLDRTSNGSEPQPTVEPSDCSERLNLLCYRY